MENRQKVLWKAVVAIILFSGTMLLMGCSKEEKTVGGALIGAGTGAVIGGAAGGAGGAVGGGILGGVAGGLIGNSMGDD